jgi:predicted short-subunit dehydrogenase-like oxidoreductase (DUF2520 family)
LVHTPTHYTAIAGTGAVAMTFAHFFRADGEPVILISRKPAQSMAGFQTVAYEDLPTNISQVLIAVPDQAITAVAERLVRSKPRLALHTSGNFGAEVLYPLSDHGTSCGAMHPLQTLAGNPDDLSALRGAAFALSGDRSAIAWAQRIVNAIGGEPLEISPEHRALYHAAAVMTSNYVTALIDTSESLFIEAGLPAETARRILGPLLRKAVENTLTQGPVAALTGPIARGDCNTVASHLKALSSVPESIQRLYRTAGLRTLDIAERKGLPGETACQLHALLQTSK